MHAGWVDHRRDRLVGRGTGSEVWLAAAPRYRAAEVPVVLKQVAPGAGAQAVRRAVERIGAFTHPGLLPVLAVWDDDDHGGAERAPGLVAVLPYVRGGTLRTLLADRGTLSEGALVAVLAEVAVVVDALHAAGLVHGDLKPENILLDEAGAPVVADPAGTPGAHGSPSYAAPELVDPAAAGPRSDVYALGVIGYEALTARRPHRGAPAEILAAAARAAHRPLGSWPAVTPAVADALEAALAPDPAERPGGAGELVARLRDAVDPAEVRLAAPVHHADAPVPWPTDHTIEFGPRPPSPPSQPSPAHSSASASLGARLRGWPTRRRSQSRRCP